MVTSTRNAIGTRTKFSRGYVTFHQEEITVGRALFDGATLMYGKAKLRRMLRTSPASVFRPLRYGRRWIDDDNGGALCVMIDHAPYLDGKPGAEHILVPGRRGWREFTVAVHRLSMQPRWAEGFSAVAESLDDMGYAIAESVVAILAFGIESDDDVALTVTRTLGRR
jgi:hypothetical protein